MPRSNRQTFLAVLIFLIAVPGLGTGIAWTLWPRTLNLPDYGWQETATSDYQPGGHGCDPARIARLRPSAKRASKRETCDEAAEQHRIDTNDLKQQTRAADAAVAAVSMAEWQSKATVFGLIVGFYTLTAAAAAAFFAKRAADETKRSADAAERAVQETQRIGEAQVRCYIALVKARVRLNGRVPIFQVEVRNTGQSPALKLVSNYGYSAIGKSAMNTDDLTMQKQVVTEDVVAQDTTWLAAWHPPEPLTLAEVENWKDGAPAIAFKVLLTGKDIFGNEFTAEDVFLCGSANIGDGEFHILGSYSQVHAEARAKVTQYRLEGKV